MMSPRRPAAWTVLCAALLVGICLYLLRSNAVVSPETIAQQSVQPGSPPQIDALPEAQDKSEIDESVLEIAKFRFATRWGKESELPMRAFSDWTAKYLAASAAEKFSLEGEGIQLAKERRQFFGKLIRRQPKLALAETVPAVIRSQLPEAIDSLLEERVTGRGDFLVLGRTDAQGVPNISRRAKIGDRTFEAYVFGDRANQKTSRQISMHGVAVDGALALSDSSLRAFEPGEPVPADKPLAADSCVVSRQPTAPTPTGPRPKSVAAESGDKVYWLCRGGHLATAAEGVTAEEGGAVASMAYSTTGPRSILVMMVDFSDRTGGATTATVALNTIASVASFIQTNAFGQINFPTRTVTPILRMPATSFSYADDPYGDTTLLEAARAAARTAGFDPFDYDFDIVVFGDIGFPWSGQGYVGDRGSWVQGSFPLGTTAHELGHNLGLWHANSWISNPTTGATGVHDEYGNVFDVMGRSSNFPNNHYNANFKYLLNWLPLSNIETVTSSGTYRIYAHDQNSKQDGRKYAIRIPVGLVARGEVEDYWIDFRQELSSRYPETTSGAIIQWGNNSGTQSASRLLDTNPDTATMDDAPLAPNQTLFDLDNNVEILNAAQGGTGPDAYVDLEIDLSLPPVIELDQALDTVDMTWTTSPNAWAGQRAVTHDGADAAASGPTADGAQSYVETTVTGPGAISFWWKVSSEETFDFLRLMTNGHVAASISGEVNWQFLTYELGSGEHTLRWVYIKDANAAGGADRAWLDQVSFATGDRPPQINFHPSPVAAAVGENATFRVDAAGSPPLVYSWLHEDKIITLATNISVTVTNIKMVDAGKYSVIVSNAFGSLTSNPALLSVVQAVPLAEALETTNIQWTTAGGATWRGQQIISHDGADSAQSGATPHSRDANLSATFVGPGTLSFWWKVSSEESFDFLSLYIDNKLVEKNSGEFDWTEKTIIIPNGSHVVQWTYSKDSTISDGDDAGWVDEVVYSYTPNMPPQILTQPRNQEVSRGGAAIFTAEFLGGEPVEFQWYHGNVPLTNGPTIFGARTARLTLTEVADEGSFSLNIKNAHGEIRTDAAALVIVPLGLGDSVEQPKRPWVIGGAGAWMAQTDVAHDNIDASSSPMIGDDEDVWFETTVAGPGSISFWWQVESERDYDFLTFAIDGYTVASISGLRPWEPFTAEFAAGEHTFRWTYKKDVDTTRYRDTGWVDQIVITTTPGQPRIENVAIDAGAITGTITPLAPFSGNVVLEVSNNLTNWTAVSTNQITSDRFNFRNNASGAAQFLRARVQP